MTSLWVTWIKKEFLHPVPPLKLALNEYFLGDEKISPSDSSGQTQNVFTQNDWKNDGKPLNWVGHWHVSFSIYLTTLSSYLRISSSDIPHALHGIPYTFSIIANIVQILLIFMILYWQYYLHSYSSRSNQN